jgi:hypothetical protein
MYISTPCPCIDVVRGADNYEQNRNMQITTDYRGFVLTSWGVSQQRDLLEQMYG